MMNEYFVDLHIHIGRTLSGKAVKITAARSLTLTNILQNAQFPKGLDIVGVVDCHSPEVIEEIEQLLASNQLIEMKEGGFRYNGKVTLIPGAEIELFDENCQGPLHVLAYFPTLLSLKEFSNWLKERVTNIQLSTQRIYEQAETLQQKVKSLGGLFIPAHIFTPFKSLYGKGVHKSLEEVLNRHLIDAMELGLSSNTTMADQVAELHHYTYVSNSDAHSLPKMAREYQVMKLKNPSFQAVKKALHKENHHEIIAHYGLNPFLGKYYRTACAKCFQLQQGSRCKNCGSTKWIQGVSERIDQLSSKNISFSNERPPYVHQVPLDFLPGIGPKTMEKLYDHFGTEMNIVHNVKEEDLLQLLKRDLVQLILKARKGELSFVQGGGGHYGKVSK